MKKILLLLTMIGLALSVSSAFAAPAKSSEANSLARQGTEAARNGQWDDAIGDLRKAAQMDRKYTPSLVAALLGRAATDAAQQQYQEAAADYDEVLKPDSKNKTALEGRASMAMKLNDMDKASEMYSDLIKIDPKEIRYYSYRAYIYELKGDLKNAMADNEKILKLQKDNPDALARKTRLETRIAQEAQNQQQQLPPPAPKGKP